MQIALRIATILLATFCLSAVSATELTPHRAEYKVRISVVTGELDTELRRTEDGYVATHVVKPTGLSRVVTSGNMFGQVGEQYLGMLSPDLATCTRTPGLRTSWYCHCPLFLAMTGG